MIFVVKSGIKIDRFDTIGLRKNFIRNSIRRENIRSLCCQRIVHMTSLMILTVRI